MNGKKLIVDTSFISDWGAKDEEWDAMDRILPFSNVYISDDCLIDLLRPKLERSYSSNLRILRKISNQAASFRILNTLDCFWDAELKGNAVELENQSSDWGYFFRDIQARKRIDRRSLRIVRDKEIGFFREIEKEHRSFCLRMRPGWESFVKRHKLNKENEIPSNLVGSFIDHILTLDETDEQVLKQIQLLAKGFGIKTNYQVCLAVGNKQLMCPAIQTYFRGACFLHLKGQIKTILPLDGAGVVSGTLRDKMNFDRNDIVDLRGFVAYAPYANMVLTNDKVMKILLESLKRIYDWQCHVASHQDIENIAELAFSKAQHEHERR